MALRETVKIIFDIIHDLANEPNGISRREIVAKYRIGESTAHKYIRLIEDMGVPIYSEGQRYLIDENYYVDLKLTSEEGEFLFLALERAFTTHTVQSQIVRSLAYKLSRKLHPHLAGELQERFQREQSNMEAARIFTTLVQAKKQRREVLVDYFPLNREEASRWRIRPYRFISNPLSDGFYALCDATRDGERFIGLSLKFDRIQDVQLTDQHFDIVDQARFQSTFGQSWGVWSGGRNPVRVVLRFEPRHYDRLLESVWHATQSIHKDADGYVIFRVEVSEPEEMVPWIRSWGSGVVVEEPPELRQRLMRSVMRQAQQYGLGLDGGADHGSFLYRLWAKREPRGRPETTSCHLLIYHLLDVAAVAAAMWDLVLGTGQRSWLENTLGLEAESTRRQLAMLAGLHDIGKATSAFQKKAPDLYAALRDAGLHERSDDTPHGTLSAVILSRWLAEKDLNKMQASQLAAVIGGHHGDWITTCEMRNAAVGKEKWRQLQKDICAELESVLDVSAITLPTKTENFNTFAAFLSGFVSVCDWIGSNSEYFPLEERSIDLGEYYKRSLESAQTALVELGWLGWTPDKREPAFESNFPCIEKANSLQRTAIDYLQGIQQMPRLILVEYMTGGGKTELALHIADLLINRFDLSGSYIAMPTQATSNQMFERFAKYLQARYPAANINFQLVHGQADQQSLYQQMPARPQRDGDESGLTAEDWFQNRKRALLAPYGIGTIDQAMLSVLQARHHFVRQFGLSQKVVIFDEIHSYDTYMNVIIERLFNWLYALNAPMILLSATLSQQNRAEILSAVGASDEAMPDVRYPRLTVVEHNGNVQVDELPLPETRTVRLEQIAPDDDSLLDVILPLYKRGGCFAVVCNTVDESIALARLLREAEEIDTDDVWLFHARFPPTWRASIEEDVLRSFGKDGERPKRAILVATQIIEQSLDLDFDLMISRTAPIDLLIQRVGRLHRHKRANRPAHLAEPTLLWREPVIGEDGMPGFGVDEVIYERLFLLKSWLKLRDMSALCTPDDIDALMDFVYSEDCAHEEIGEHLRAAYEEMNLGDANSAFRGKQYVIGAPEDEEMIDSNTFRLRDDLKHHVSTRDIMPGVDIVCVINPDLVSRLNHEPGKEDVNELLKHKVTVRSAKVKDGLEGLREHDKWENKAQLKYARVVRFEGGRFNVPKSDYALRLTQEYGLEIIPKEDA